jgi:hypothetical protein
MRRTHLSVLPLAATLALGAALLATTAAEAAPTPRTISLSATTYDVAEDAAPVTITLQRSDSTRATSVLLETADGTAAAASDYTALSTRVEFAAGSSTATATVDITDDSAAEDAETFTVTLSRARGGFKVTTPSTTTVTIGASDQTIVANGGFEANWTSWTERRPGGTDQPKPALVTSPVSTGTQAMRLGGSYFPGTPKDSQIMQRITLPSTGVTTLAWSYILEGTDLGSTAAYDWGDVLIFDLAGNIIADVFVGETAATSWTQGTSTLSALSQWSTGLAGQTVDLVFGVRQDGYSPWATMYVDDIIITNTP